MSEAATITKRRVRISLPSLPVAFDRVGVRVKEGVARAIGINSVASGHRVSRWQRHQIRFTAMVRNHHVVELRAYSTFQIAK